MTETPSAEETFPATLDSPGQARAWARRRLEELGTADPEGRVLLAVSELATNAVKHGGSPFTLVIEPAGASVVVKVRDSNPTAPVRRPLDGAAEDGRGIVILSSLAEVWGVEGAGTDTGKTVWARIHASDDDRGSMPSPGGRPTGRRPSTGYR